MDYSPENADIVLQMINEILNNGQSSPDRLKRIWWMLLFARSKALSGSIRPLLQDKVYAGPFKGMALTEEAIHNYRTPILLGCYETELHATFEGIIAAGYTRILNIGCSVGYYAVGLAQRMPHVQIEAFDTCPEAQKRCQDMVKLNGLENRVRISGEFSGENFAAYAQEKTLILMDIEGGEKDLLDPAKYPALQKMDILVELHDLLHPGLSKNISERFTTSHHVEIIKNKNLLPDIGNLLPPDTYLDPFDHLLLGWECRDGSTPWGIYRVKAA